MMMITDEMVGKAHVAMWNNRGNHMDQMRAALEAVAPALIAQGMREAALICLKAEYPDVAIEARAQELDPR